MCFQVWFNAKATVKVMFCACCPRAMSPTSSEVAVKVTSLLNPDGEISQQLLEEPELMSRLSEVTGAVVKVLDYQRQGDTMVMVMELGQETLMDVINREEAVTLLCSAGSDSSVLQGRRSAASAGHCPLLAGGAALRGRDPRPGDHPLRHQAGEPAAGRRQHQDHRLRLEPGAAGRVRQCGGGERARDRDLPRPGVLRLGAGRRQRPGGGEEVCHQAQVSRVAAVLTRHIVIHPSYTHLQPEGGHLVARRAAHEATAPGTRGQLAQVSRAAAGKKEVSTKFLEILTIFGEGCFMDL